MGKRKEMAQRNGDATWASRRPGMNGKLETRERRRSVEGGGFRAGELELLLLGLGARGREAGAGAAWWIEAEAEAGGLDRGNEEIPRKKGRWVAAARE